MKLVNDAPNRSAWAFSQSFRGPYPQLVFLGKLFADAFRAIRSRARSR
jgi:hypothetical protein